jgi:hypothetical protein
MKATAMTFPAKKFELLELIEQKHETLNKCLESLDKTALSRQGIEVGWADENVAVKDILVHVTMWEKRMLAGIAENLGGELSQDYRYSLGTGEFNKLIYKENMGRSAHEVLQDYQSTYRTVLHTLNELDETALLTANAGAIINYNTYSHYNWAVKKIRPCVRAQRVSAERALKSV